MFLRSLRLVLALALAVPVGLALPPAPVVSLDVDWGKFLGPYPVPGSEQAKGEEAILFWLQRTRTREDVARARATDWLVPDAFADLYPGGFRFASKPKTAALLEAGRVALRPAVAVQKKNFRRARPFLALEGLHPCVEKELTGSYPSGHASLAGLLARILAELDPPHREAILERGNQVAHDRVLAGAHWPSDVEAGLRMGAAFAEGWMAEHRAEVDAVIAAEWKR